MLRVRTSTRRQAVTWPSSASDYRLLRSRHMAFQITRWCGCQLCVTCDPETGGADERFIQRRGDRCLEDDHEVGVYLPVWELLPRPVRFDPRTRYVFSLKSA